MRITLKEIYAATFALFIGVAAFGGKMYWDDRYETGYVAFNAGEFLSARSALSPIAELGDPHAQQLMAYMSGLGLDGPVDVADALRWFAKKVPRGTSVREHVGEQAFYMGKEAIDGRYGASKGEIGRLWLQIAAVSGSTAASHALSAVSK